MSALLSPGGGGGSNVVAAVASPAALRAYVAARARAAASGAAADASAHAARAAELGAWSSRLGASGGTLATLLRDAAEAHAASPLAASRDQVRARDGARFPRFAPQMSALSDANAIAPLRASLSFAHAQAALADARAEARRLLAAAHDEAEPLPLPLPLPLPQTARLERGTGRRSTPPRSAPLLPSRPPWERWTSPSRARRAGSEPARRGRSGGGNAPPTPFASVTPVRLDYRAGDDGRYSRYSAAQYAIPLGATSAERAAAVMSVRRATRASDARARAETYAHLRDVR